jgi:hypothetical protein
VAEIGECTLEAIIAPRGIFTGHAEEEFTDLLGDPRASRLLASLAVIPLSGHQFPMPAKDGVRSKDRGNFLQCLAAQYLPFDGEAAPLVVAKQDAFLAKLLFEHLVFGAQVFECVLLMTVDPAGQN